MRQPTKTNSVKFLAFMAILTQKKFLSILESFRCCWAEAVVALCAAQNGKVLNHIVSRASDY